MPVGEELNIENERASHLWWLGERRPFLSQGEAAHFLGKSVKTIYRMRKSGELGFITSDSGQILIPLEALEFWCDSHYYGPASTPDAGMSPIANADARTSSILVAPVISLSELDAALDQSEETQ